VVGAKNELWTGKKVGENGVENDVLTGTNVDRAGKKAGETGEKDVVTGTNVDRTGTKEGEKDVLTGTNVDRAGKKVGEKVLTGTNVDRTGTKAGLPRNGTCARASDTETASRPSETTPRAAEDSRERMVHLLMMFPPNGTGRNSPMPPTPPRIHESLYPPPLP
jgi:hypothetical protein